MHETFHPPLSPVILRERLHNLHRFDADAHYLANEADDVLLVFGVCRLRNVCKFSGRKW